MAVVGGKYKNCLDLFLISSVILGSLVNVSKLHSQTGSNYIFLNIFAKIKINNASKVLCIIFYSARAAITKFLLRQHKCIFSKFLELEIQVLSAGRVGFW